MTRTVKHYVCRQLPHYVQRRKPFEVHIIERDDSLEVYYQKDQYPAFYAFGIQKKYIDLEYAFSIAWANLKDYEGDMFND